MFALFRHCPSLFDHAGQFDEILESWKEYKMTVPTYGAILLDPSLQFVSLFSQYFIQLSDLFYVALLRCCSFSMLTFRKRSSLRLYWLSSYVSYVIRQLYFFNYTSCSEEGTSL